LFKKECSRWISFWGLTTWDVSFNHGKTDDDNVAECNFDASNRWAVITLANKLRDDGIGYNFKRTAFHEVCELRYAQIRVLAGERYISYREVDSAIHELIRQDENLIFKNCK
jgi:hypothetical protein